MTDVYALGSCRLRAPLLHLHRAGQITFTNATASWYAHNSAECLQRIAMTDGDMSLPEGLRPLILNRDSCPADWEEGVRPIPPGCLGLFEIGTRMQRRLDPYVLHSTCVSKTGFTEARSHVMSWAELEADIMALSARFPHVILVGNLAMEADLITPNPGRVALNQYLQNIAEEHPGLSYADPNPHIAPHAPGADLVDNNHFKPAFERRMADVYLAAIAAARMSPPVGALAAGISPAPFSPSIQNKAR